MRPPSSGPACQQALERTVERLRALGATVLWVDGFDFAQHSLVFSSRFDLDGVAEAFGPLLGIWYVAPLEPAPDFQDVPTPVGFLLGHIHQDVFYQWEVLAQDYLERLDKAGVTLPAMEALGREKKEKG